MVYEEILIGLLLFLYILDWRKIIMCMESLNATKYIRGQVWFVREDSDVTKALRNAGSKVINGDRPYLILNLIGNYALCCPLTTNVNEHYSNGNDIVFEHNNGTGGGYDKSRIVISQLTTKNTFEFERYLYTFDKESIDIIMEKVYDQLGLKVSKEEPIEERVVCDEPIRIGTTFRIGTTLLNNDLTPMYIDNDIMANLEKRLMKKKKTATLFETKEEACCYLAKWGRREDIRSSKSLWH